MQVGTIPASTEFVNVDLYEIAHLQHIADPYARSKQIIGLDDQACFHGCDGSAACMIAYLDVASASDPLLS